MITPRLYPVALILPLAVALSGCAGFAWFVNAFAPPKKVDAIYTLPKDKKVLVFVDDLLKPVSYEPVKAELAERLSKQLIEHKVAKETIPHEELLTLMAATPEFNKLGVADVGQKLGADLVVYVEIDEFALKDDESSPLWHGRMGASVRIVDAQGTRLWPDDRAGGYPVPMVETPDISDPSPEYGENLSRAIADLMADRIAKLFYKHEETSQETVAAEKGPSPSVQSAP